MTGVFVPPAFAEPVPLDLPELREDRFPGTVAETFNYFDFDYSSPLVQHDEHRFEGPLGKPISWKAAANWLRGTLFRSGSPLFHPGEEYTTTEIIGAWNEEIPDGKTEVLPDEMLEALRQAPPIFVCYYERLMSQPPEFRRKSVLHVQRADIAFWSSAPPAELQPTELRNFEGSNSGINPLILIGPPVDACPETLGAALETLASNAPDLVPAANSGFGEATTQAFTGRK